MSNELLLCISVILLFGGTLLFYYLMGVTGLYCWTVLATISANIEVLILIKAFGMEQTLGNVMFASTFLVTDIISEIGGKEKANRAVNIGARRLGDAEYSGNFFKYTASDACEFCRVCNLSEI